MAKDEVCRLRLYGEGFGPASVRICNYFVVVVVV